MRAWFLDAGLVASSAALLLAGCGDTRDENDSVGISMTAAGSGDTAGDDDDDDEMTSTGDDDDDDDSDGTADTGTGETGVPSACEPIETIAAPLVAQPADMVLLVDNSSTMMQEAPLIQGVLNDFIEAIEPSAEPRLAIVSAYPDPGAMIPGVCVPPPLGSGNCPDDDNNPPDFVHVPVNVAGNSALSTVLIENEGWDDIQREDSVVHLMVISDRDSGFPAGEFDTQFQLLAENYVFHASVPAQDPAAACSSGGLCCNVAQNIGDSYTELATLKGGVVHDMCSQNFGMFFLEVAASVLFHGTNRCEWLLPEGQDPTMVNLLIQIDGGPFLSVPHRPSLASCDPNNGGWYYDSPGSPSRLILCPQTCQPLGLAQTVFAQLELGCPTY